MDKQILREVIQLVEDVLDPVNIVPSSEEIQRSWGIDEMVDFLQIKTIDDLRFWLPRYVDDLLVSWNTYNAALPEDEQLSEDDPDWGVVASMQKNEVDYMDKNLYGWIVWELADAVVEEW